MKKLRTISFFIAKVAATAIHERDNIKKRKGESPLVRSLKSHTD
jgi:hypothetical protein